MDSGDSPDYRLATGVAGWDQWIEFALFGVSSTMPTLELATDPHRAVSAPIFLQFCLSRILMGRSRC